LDWRVAIHLGQREFTTSSDGANDEEIVESTSPINLHRPKHLMKLIVGIGSVQDWGQVDISQLSSETSTFWLSIDSTTNTTTTTTTNDMATISTGGVFSDSDATVLGSCYLAPSFTSSGVEAVIECTHRLAVYGTAEQLRLVRSRLQAADDNNQTFSGGGNYRLEQSEVAQFSSGPLPDLFDMKLIQTTSY
jgi:hypothetical protein